MSEISDAIQDKCLSFGDRIIKLNDYLLEQASQKYDGGSKRYDVRKCKSSFSPHTSAIFKPSSIKHHPSYTHHPSYFRHHPSFIGLWRSFIYRQINKKLMNNTKYKKLEDALLNATDLLIEKAKSQGEKALYNLFKSAILKKYRDQYDVDIQQGEVKKETVDKSIDFLFENACVSFRTLPNIKDSDKEDVIRQAQAALPSWKALVIQNLTNKGIKVV